MRNGVVVLAALFVVGCQTAQRPMLEPPDPKAPVIRVFMHQGNVTVRPWITVAHRRDASQKPVVVKWVTPNPADQLDIKFDEEGCVDESTKSCVNNVCTFDTLALPERQRCDKVCKYTVILNRIPLDPILVIDDN